MRSSIAVAALVITTACAVAPPPPESPLKTVVSGAFDILTPRWSPDGSRIAFTANFPDGKSYVYVVDSAGGVARRLLPTYDESALPAWSPDGRSVVFLSDRSGHLALWTAELESGSLRRITAEGSFKPADAVFPINPDWSPDGKTIVFTAATKGTYDIWSVSAGGGGEAVRLTSHEEHEYAPRWSPDGRSVVFYTTWGLQKTEVWTVSVADGALRRITDDPVEDFAPEWSPDGAMVLYCSRRLGEIDLWASRLSDGRAMPLVRSRGRKIQPDWSPDGKSIAFVEIAKHHLYSIAVDGGPPRLLTRDPDRGESQPVFAPDGRLALTADGFRCDHRLVVRDSSGNERVFPDPDGRTDTAVMLESLSWSPDGERVAYLMNRGGGPFTLELRIANADGSDSRPFHRTGSDRNPIWCRDGSLIFFTSERSVWSGSPDGGEPRREEAFPPGAVVTDCRSSSSLVYQSSGSVYERGAGVTSKLELGAMTARGAKTSPDGSALAFLGTVNGQTDVYVRRYGEVVRLTNDELRETHLSWTPDGTAIVYARKDGYDLLRVADVR
jgi:TolB protein